MYNIIHTGTFSSFVSKLQLPDCKGHLTYVKSISAW